MRTEQCLTCGETFTAPYRHPMIEEAWCTACLTILRECVIEQFALVVWPVAAIRSSEV